LTEVILKSRIPTRSTLKNASSSSLNLNDVKKIPKVKEVKPKAEAVKAIKVVKKTVVHDRPPLFPKKVVQVKKYVVLDENRDFGLRDSESGKVWGLWQTDVEQDWVLTQITIEAIFCVRGSFYIFCHVLESNPVRLNRRQERDNWTWAKNCDNFKSWNYFG